MKIITKQAVEILDNIEKYDRIVVFRHESPDFDALGSQFGLVYWLQDNFPNKEIFAPGYSFTEVGKNLFPKNDEISDEKLKEKPFLALILDTSDSKRISDKRYVLADKIIKIDHHPFGENYGDINLVRTDAGAAAELIYALLRTKPFRKYPITDRSARYLYVGIVGDTGRFQYSNATSFTMKCASELVKYKFNPQKEVYYPIYNKPIEDFEAIRTVMNNFHVSPKGVAYYHLSIDDLKRLGIDSDDGKAYLYLFNYCDKILVWCAFCQDERTGNWRASLRSRDITVNAVAAKHNGGGHRVASGARPKNYEETLEVVKELDEVITNLGL